MIFLASSFPFSLAGRNTIFPLNTPDIHIYLQHIQFIWKFQPSHNSLLYKKTRTRSVFFQHLMKKFVASVLRFHRIDFLISSRSSSASATTTSSRDTTSPYFVCLLVSLYESGGFSILCWIVFVAIQTNVIFMIIHKWLFSVFFCSHKICCNKFCYLFYRFCFYLNWNWNWNRLCKYKSKRRVLSFWLETTPYFTCLPVNCFQLHNWLTFSGYCKIKAAQHFIDTFFSKVRTTAGLL